MKDDVYVATVQIAFEAKSHAEACDWISGMFEHVSQAAPMDWAYLRIGAHYMYPTPQMAGEGWDMMSLRGDK